MINSIKALHLIAGTGIGGSEILALNLAKYHSPQLLDLHIISTKKGELATEFQRSLPSFNIFKRNAFLDPGLICRLFFYCRKNKIEIIHCHQLLECLNAYVVARILRIRVILTFHGFYYFDKNQLVRFLGKMLVRKIDCSLFVSHLLKDHYIEKYHLTNIRAEVIYNGTALTDMNLPDRDSLRMEFGLAGTDIVIGMTGNFSSARNHILLCKVFGRLIATHPYSDRLHMIFIGGIDKAPSPKYREAYNFCLESGLLKRIHFAGKRINASNLLGNFDIFVYSTHRETFCLSVTEAIIAGIPVLVNDLPVMREITEDGILADLYKTDNPDDFFEKLSESLMHLEELKAISEGRKQKAFRKYSLQNYQEQLFDLYNRTI